MRSEIVGVFLLGLLSIVVKIEAATKVCNVLDYGAKADNKTDVGGPIRNAYLYDIFFLYLLSYSPSLLPSVYLPFSTFFLPPFLLLFLPHPSSFILHFSSSLPLFAHSFNCNYSECGKKSNGDGIVIIPEGYYLMNTSVQMGYTDYVIQLDGIISVAFNPAGMPFCLLSIYMFIILYFFSCYFVLFLNVNF